MSAVWLHLDSSPGCGTQIVRFHPLCAGPQADKCLLNPVSPFFVPNPPGASQHRHNNPIHRHGGYTEGAEFWVWGVRRFITFFSFVVCICLRFTIIRALLGASRRTAEGMGAFAADHLTWCPAGIL